MWSGLGQGEDTGWGKLNLQALDNGEETGEETGERREEGDERAVEDATEGGDERSECRAYFLEGGSPENVRDEVIS